MDRFHLTVEQEFNSNNKSNISKSKFFLILGRIKFVLSEVHLPEAWLAWLGWLHLFGPNKIIEPWFVKQQECVNQRQTFCFSQKLPEAEVLQLVGEQAPETVANKWCTWWADSAVVYEPRFTCKSGIWTWMKQMLKFSTVAEAQRGEPNCMCDCVSHREGMDWDGPTLTI